jgi:hypothetical protein
VTKSIPSLKSKNMKKVLLSLFLLLIASFCFGQNSESTVYKIFRTEFYIYSQSEEKWVLQSRNDDVEIDMVSYKNVINIQAKTPTLFRIDKTTEESIGGGNKDYFGYRYAAIECVNMNKCTIDLVRLSDLSSKNFLFSVIFRDEVVGKVNLRYYSTLE